MLADIERAERAGVDFLRIERIKKPAEFARGSGGYLRVISRSSTLRFTDAAFDVRTAGKELGARYVMERSLRQTGTQLRVTVQLVDAATGAHLWAETYERGFGPESAFVTQDELVPRLVATIADVHGILPRSMSAVLRMAGL